jgi:hypothetical protein
MWKVKSKNGRGEKTVLKAVIQHKTMGKFPFHEKTLIGSVDTNSRMPEFVRK